MAELSSQLDAVDVAGRPDGVRVRRWLAVYGLFFLAGAAPLAALIVTGDATWDDWRTQFVDTFGAQPSAVKLLALGLYLSLCCTFLPMPTAWIVGAVALPAMAVGWEFWTTTLIVAAVAAAGSTMANLNDYHLFTWLLRHKRIGAVRNTRLYRRSAKWFARSPFAILVIFNIIPIPVDVIRMLATTARYPRLPFAAANFIGRFVRYGVIAGGIYLMGAHGWIAVLVLLGIAVVMGIERGIAMVIRRQRKRREAAA